MTKLILDTGSKIGIIGIIIGIILYTLVFIYSNKERKPVYHLDTEIPIASILPNSSLKIFWNTEEIDNLYTRTITFWNKGRQYIDENSISKTEPITIAVDSCIKILDANILKESRDSTFIIEKCNNKIIIKLNGDEAIERKDGLQISMFYTSSQKACDIQIHGRIKGAVNGIQESILESSRVSKWQLFIGFILILIGIISIVYLVKYSAIISQKVGIFNTLSALGIDTSFIYATPIILIIGGGLIFYFWWIGLSWI